MLERIDYLRKGGRKITVIYYYEKIFKLLVNFLSDSLKFSLFPTQCPNKDNPSNSGVKSEEENLYHFLVTAM